MNPIGINSYNTNSCYNPYQTQYSPQSYYGPYYDMQDNTSGENPAKTLGLAALLQGLAMGIKKASEFFSKKLAAGKEFTSAENVVQVAKNMLNKNKLSTKVFFINPQNQNQFAGLGKEMVNEVAKGRNAFFHRGVNIAVAPSSKPSLILHELGHAVNFTKPILRSLQKFGGYAVAAPTALLLANRAFSNKQDGQKTFIEKNAGILGFCAYIPTLIEEGIASLRGINAAKKVLNNPKSLNILKKNYALAWMTYLLGAVALGVASKQAVVEDNL